MLKVKNLYETTEELEIFCCGMLKSLGKEGCVC